MAVAADADASLPEINVSVTQAQPGRANDPVITGFKTDTVLRDLPASVVVVPAATQRKQGTYDMNRALENASGVQPQMAGGYGFANNYSIRALPMWFLRDGYLMVRHKMDTGEPSMTSNASKY